MKKQKKFLSAIQNWYVANPRKQYSLVISWCDNWKKMYESHKIASRELDIQSKARTIFYRIVKEKSGMILHNMQKPFEQDIHNIRRKKGIIVESKNWIHNQNINNFEYTYCIA